MLRGVEQATRVMANEHKGGEKLHRGLIVFGG